MLLECVRACQRLCIWYGGTPGTGPFLSTAMGCFCKRKAVTTFPRSMSYWTTREHLKIHQRGGGSWLQVLTSALCLEKKKDGRRFLGFGRGTKEWILASGTLLNYKQLKGINNRYCSGFPSVKLLSNRFAERSSSATFSPQLVSLCQMWLINCCKLFGRVFKLCLVWCLK